MTLCLPKTDRMVREQEAEDAKRRGWAVGREASLLMHRWLDTADEKGSVEIDIKTQAELIAAHDLMDWHENHGITRYSYEYCMGVMVITRVN